MSNTAATSSPEWNALTSGAAWYARPHAGVLVLEDADRVDFLQRLTTNDVTALQPGQAAVTVLTSPTARIVFVFTVLQQGERLLLLPAPGQSAALLRYLRGQIFFMDKVRVGDLSGDFARLRVVGPQAGAANPALGLPATPSDGTFAERGNLIAVVDLRYELPGVELLVSGGEAAVADAATRLSALGAVEVNDIALLDARRIELGLPAPDAELTGESNPLEAGLAWACAQNKGCYTGQEILARQITYDKVTRSLVGLRSQSLLVPGTPLFADGRDVGTVTSAAHSLTFKAPLALAIVRRPWHTPGSALVARAADGSESHVTVASVPFVTENRTAVSESLHV